MTHYLYAVPSLFDGFSRVLDLGATQTIYNESLTEPQADSSAIKADWHAVGQDMYEAILNFAESHAATPKK